MSDSGLDAYDKRDVVIGNRKSSDKDSRGYFLDRFCLHLIGMEEEEEGN